MIENIKELRMDTDAATEFFAAKLAYTLGPVELQEMLKKPNIKLIDVRHKEDYDEGHISPAISIPKDELKDRLEILSKNDVNIVYCYNQQCHLGASSAYILAKNGYPVMELDGGFDTWAEVFKFEVVK